MTYAYLSTSAPPTPSGANITELHMLPGDSVKVFAHGHEYTLWLRDDNGTIALCLSQTLPQYGYARTYNSVSTFRTEHHGFVVTEKDLEEEDQPKAEA